MGSPRRCGDGVFRIGPGGDSQGTNGHADGHVRRVRARPRPLTRAAAVAVFLATATAGAQGRTPPDSGAGQSRVTFAARDTIKAPFAVSEAPPAIGDGRRTRWTRDELFQTGALNLAEFLERALGLQVLRSGFALAPQVALWYGDPGRVRIFVDGVEHDALDAREGRVRDLGALPIWYTEEVLVDPVPGELRVHLRSWRGERTTPETRVDVYTGDAETNLYRGYFGRRFQSGLGVQFGFQQFASVEPAVGGDGDGLSLFARVGVARPNWSVDLVSQRAGRSRSATLREDAPGSVPALSAAASLSYARVAWRSPDGERPWAQLIIAASGFDETTPIGQLSPEFGTAPADSADTTAFRAQYVLVGGTKILGVHTSATVRYRRFLGAGYLTPSARLHWNTRRTGAAVSAERAAEDSTNRLDVGVRYSPTEWLGVSTSASLRSPVDDTTRSRELIAAGELTLRARGYALSAGVVTRDSTRVAAPVVFARGILDTVASSATAMTLALDGPVFRAVRFNVRGTQWESADFYRPQTSVRAQLGIDTEWRSRFPLGQFTFRAFATLEYRGESLIPTESGTVVLPSWRIFSTLTEVRIKSATITWQFRNLLGANYETVPGYRMPKLINLYGVRWAFWD